MVFVNLLGPGMLKCRDLHVRVLVVGGDANIADFHSAIMFEVYALQRNVVERIWCKLRGVCPAD